jgi:hypothetical protein
MQVVIINPWNWLCISMAITLFTSFLMHLQSAQFYTNDVLIRKFSILDMQFPATARELPNLINGIYLLPAPQQQKTLRALRGQLWLDFLFMPAFYGSIFLLCMQVAGKMEASGRIFFAVLAWLQFVPWICDIIEGIYLLGKIHPNVPPSTPRIHRAYQLLEVCKWGTFLTATVCALSALLFFWLTGRYETASLQYLLILTGEIVLFGVVVYLASLREGAPAVLEGK